MMQLPLLVPHSDWRPPRIADLPSFRDAKRVAIDTETCDPTLKQLGPGVRRGGYIVGYSYAIEDGPKHYIPLKHDGGDNVEDAQQALGWLREEAKEFTGELVGANLGYDLDYLWEQNILFPKLKAYRDVQVAEPLIDDLAMSYSLETICNKYLGVGKEEGILREAAVAFGVDPKKDLWRLPARYVGNYAEGDANLPLLALRRQEKEIDSQGLWPIYNMESELLPILIKMRRRGVRIDLDKLTKVEEWSALEERKALAQIKHLTGHEIPFNSVWQPTMLVRPLESIGVHIPLTPKTRKPSIDKAFLVSIKHPVADAINRARRVNKIRTTFAQSIRNHMTNGRIHATFHQLRSSTEEDEDGDGKGARFGRCSSSNPNMMQQPARDPEIGPMWKEIYLPEEGEIFWSADYKTQEPRHTVHYAANTRLGNVGVNTANGFKWINADESARKIADQYRNDPNTDPHQALANIIMGRQATKKERDDIKIIFLGLSYGMGGAKLAKSLGLSTFMGVREEATGRVLDCTSDEGRRIVMQGGKIYEAAGPEGQALMDKFDESVPFVKALARICKKAANTYGSIRTQSGRKCRFPKDFEGNLLDQQKSMNKLIQASAADQTKQSMVSLDREGISFMLQIHDELCGSMKHKNEGERIVHIMKSAYKLSVPILIDFASGENWGNLH